MQNRSKQIDIYHVSDGKLLERLELDAIAQCNLEMTVTDPRYDRIKKYMLVQYLNETTHPIQEILESKSLFKSYLNKIDLEDRKKIMGVEIYLDKQRENPSIDKRKVIDEKLLSAMYSPHGNLKPNHQDLIWKLLVNIAPLDILFTYWYDKDEFYKKYNTWDDSMKDWVIDTIRNNF
jgi:hypothetical protein